MSTSVQESDRIFYPTFSNDKVWGIRPCMALSTEQFTKDLGFPVGPLWPSMVSDDSLHFGIILTVWVAWGPQVHMSRSVLRALFSGQCYESMTQLDHQKPGSQLKDKHCRLQSVSPINPRAFWVPKTNPSFLLALKNQKMPLLASVLLAVGECHTVVQ